jgi:hypothetical protein
VASDDDLPRAYLARVPFPAGGKVSAVLVPRPMAFLAVQLLFEGDPAVGRQVQFFECSDDAGDDEPSKGDAIGDPLPSDDQGVARLPRLVAAGHYVCEIDGQEDALVSTVNRLSDAHPVYLPIDAEVVDDHTHGADANGSEEEGG